MKEFVTANGTTFECSSVTTGFNSITFTMDSAQWQTADSATAFFKGVSELTVSMESGGVPHGIYEHLAFESATNYADDSVSVTMHMKDKIEMRLDALEEEQEVQNGAIEELGEIAGGAM